MKKTIIALVAVFGMALTANAQKFGHVDTQSIMQSLPEVTKTQGELQAIAQQYDNELKAMQDEIQKQADAYEKKAATMNETQRKAEEAKLQELGQKYQQTAQQNQTDFQKKQEEKMQPIVTKLQNAITAVGKAGGYVYIMDLSMGIPYVSDSLSEDVTTKVKAELKK